MSESENELAPGNEQPEKFTEIVSIGETDVDEHRNLTTSQLGQTLEADGLPYRSWRRDKTSQWERQITGAFQTAKLPPSEVWSEQSPERSNVIANLFDEHLSKWTSQEE